MIGKPTRRRETADKANSELAYCRLGAPSPKRVKQTVRSQWRLDNRLHRRFEMVMNSDQNRTRLGKGPDGPAVLRHTVVD